MLRIVISRISNMLKTFQIMIRIELDMGNQRGVSLHNFKYIIRRNIALLNLLRTTNPENFSSIGQILLKIFFLKGENEIALRRRVLNLH